MSSRGLREVDIEFTLQWPKCGCTAAEPQWTLGQCCHTFLHDQLRGCDIWPIISTVVEDLAMASILHGCHSIELAAQLVCSTAAQLKRFEDLSTTDLTFFFSWKGKSVLH